MKLKVFLSIVVFAVISFLTPLFGAEFDTYAIGFYNLENLFDTINDPTLSKNDEFTPTGTNKWGTMKYNAKLQNMSYAISKIAVTKLTPDGVAVLGVSEIENRSVLEDLVKQPSIADRNFQIVHHDGPDRRGVDCALLYNPKYFTVTDWKSIPFKIKNNPNFRSRDQLLVTGILSGEEISIIVNHWPSRYGGEVASRSKRVAAAELTRSICDSLLSINSNAKIIIMGDLNDDPTDVSCSEILNAKKDISEVERGGLYNTMWPIFDKGNGSLGYNDVWCLYDQIIISHGWLGRDYSSLRFVKPEVFNKPFLTEQTGKRKGYPLRTHAAGVWKNGYSDHFPTLIYVAKNKQKQSENKIEKPKLEDAVIVETEKNGTAETTLKSELPMEIVEIIKTIPANEFTNFSMNEVVVKDESVIVKIANLLIDNENLQMELIGHTCNSGTEEYNIELSRKRAESVKRLLLDKGVPSDRVKVTAKGMSEPLVPNTTEENKRKNRRVDFLFF